MKRLDAAMAALILAGAASAQTPAPAAPFDAAARKQAVETAQKALRTQYVFPEVGAEAADRLESSLAAGAYDGLDRIAFAHRITADLREIAHDKHLSVIAPDIPPPGLPPGPPPRSQAGVTRADRLPGGVGYIEVIGFPPLPVFRRAVDEAMAKLANAPALIIDARRNGGGDPASVAYLVSWLEPDGRKAHLNDLLWRKEGTSEYRREEFWTIPTPGHIRAKRIIVLTSARTFSGGEEFAYDVQTQKLAALIGETTGGGANPGGVADLGSNLAMFVPRGRAENPITKTNWEGRGVAPDFAVPADQALKVALEHLGQNPKALEVAALSKAQLFSPRTTEDPGAQAALRRLLEGTARGEPPYGDMAPQFAESIRGRLPKAQGNLAALGAIEAVAFKEVDRQGDDVYEVKFAHGVKRCAIALGADGKIAGAFMLDPPT